ncbi:MAG: PIN domain-containing protein [Solirubrobacterales bacterium]
MYCFDTDVLSATIRRDPSLPVIRRLAQVLPPEQFTTAITMGELLYGAARRNNRRLSEQVRDLIRGAVTILPFDESAADVYGPLRAQLEAGGQPLAEPDLRIASIALSRDLTLVTGNTRRFDRIPGLAIENWLRTENDPNYS